MHLGYAEARADDVIPIIRKRCASALGLLRGSSNNIMSVFFGRFELNCINDEKSYGGVLKFAL